MAINFPNSPSVNDIHSEGGVRWKWNGSSWTRSSSGPAITDTITTVNDNSTTTLYPVMVTGAGSNGAKVATSATKSISFDASDGNLTVAGNISVGGTLTYEDVKNVDSVGVGTFRSGAHFGPSTGVGATISSEGDITAGIITATFVGDGSGLTGVANTDYVHAHTLSVVGVTTLTTLNVNSQVGAAGSVLSSTGSGLNWVSPQTGPQGAQGVQGAAGSSGAVGAQGAQGHQGLTGATGAQGHQGHQGAVGAQGNQGVQGAGGAAGAQGHQGVQGAGGAAGAQGNQGVQGATNNLTVSTSPPGSPSAGDMWWDSDDGRLGVYYNDGNSSQWVNINNGPAGAQGAQGAQGRQGATGAQGSVGIASLTISTGAPSSPDAGDMWWDSDDGDLHLYFNDGNSSQWVNINAGSAGAQGVQGATGAAGAQGAAGSATLSNNANNRVITGGSGTNLNGEANLTFDSSQLTLTSSHLLLGTDGYRIKLGTANDFQLWHTGSVNKIQSFVGDIQYISPTGSGHSFQVNSAEKIRIDSSGRLLTGGQTTSVADASNLHADIQSHSADGNGLSLGRYSNNAYDPYITFFKSRNATIGSNGTILQDGDTIGTLTYYGATGSAWDHVAYQAVKVDGTPGASNDMPVRFDWHNQADGQQHPAHTMSLRASGDLEVKTGNVVIGTAGKGISFAATSDASGMTNELMDDYEEGSWTPIIYAWNGTQNQSYDTQTGNYIKIGNQVFANFTIDFSNKGTVSGNYTFVSGLPYNHAGVTGGSGTLVTWGWAMASNISWVAGDVSSTTTVVWLSYHDGSNNNTNYLPASMLYDNTQLKGTIIYRSV